jgi:hypothetical protein
VYTPPSSLQGHICPRGRHASSVMRRIAPRHEQLGRGASATTARKLQTQRRTTRTETTAETSATRTTTTVAQSDSQTSVSSRVASAPPTHCVTTRNRSAAGLLVLRTSVSLRRTSAPTPALLERRRGRQRVRKEPSALAGLASGVALLMLLALAKLRGVGLSR